MTTVKTFLQTRIQKKITDKVSASSGNSECYFFRKIKSDDVVLKTNEEISIGAGKYSIQKIVNFYFLQITAPSLPVQNRKVFIEVLADDIIVSN